MLILAIETSGDLCSVALLDEGECVFAEYAFVHRRQLTERLPGAIEFVLADHGRALADIDAFVCGLGPGSFTGVRVAVTFAKLYAETLQKPLVGVSSLDALASAIPQFDGVTLAVAPSRKDELIVAAYTFPDGPNAELFDGPRTMSTADVRKWCEALRYDGSVLVAGEAAGWIGRIDGVQITSEAPRAGAVARLAAAQLKQGRRDDPATLAPLYVAPLPIRGGKSD